MSDSKAEAVGLTPRERLDRAWKSIDAQCTALIAKTAVAERYTAELVPLTKALRLQAKALNRRLQQSRTSLSVCVSVSVAPPIEC
jgi:hypothetical protein